MNKKKEDFEKIVNEITNAFFRLESFTNNRIQDYKYFGFKSHFEKLFISGLEDANYTPSNSAFISDFYKLISQITYDYDKSGFDNENVYENEDLYKDCGELDELAWDYFDEWEKFENPEDIEEEITLSYILKNRKPETHQKELESNKPLETLALVCLYILESNTKKDESEDRKSVV